MDELLVNVGSGTNQLALGIRSRRTSDLVLFVAIGLALRFSKTIFEFCFQCCKVLTEMIAQYYLKTICGKLVQTSVRSV